MPYNSALAPHCGTFQALIKLNQPAGVRVGADVGPVGPYRLAKHVNMYA